LTVSLAEPAVLEEMDTMDCRAEKDSREKSAIHHYMGPEVKTGEMEIRDYPVTRDSTVWTEVPDELVMTVSPAETDGPVLTAPEELKVTTDCLV